MDKYKVLISSAAHGDIVECVGFLANVNMEAAINFKKEILDFAKSLEILPYRFPVVDIRMGSDEFRKAVIAKHYIVVISIIGDTVTIERVLDARKGYQMLL